VCVCLFSPQLTQPNSRRVKRFKDGTFPIKVKSIKQCNPTNHFGESNVKVQILVYSKKRCTLCYREQSVLARMGDSQLLDLDR